MKVLKIYSASWCQPCQMLKKTIQNSDLGVSILNVDIDTWKEEAKLDNVRSVPTIILQEDGVELKRTTGYKNLDQLTAFINS